MSEHLPENPGLRELQKLQDELDAETAFETESLQGRRQLNEDQFQSAVSRLNLRLERDLKHKRRRRKPLDVSATSLIAVGTVLMLIILIWLVMRLAK